MRCHLLRKSKALINRVLIFFYRLQVSLVVYCFEFVTNHNWFDLVGQADFLTNITEISSQAKTYFAVYVINIFSELIFQHVKSKYSLCANIF